MHAPCRRVGVNKKKALILFDDESRAEEERRLLQSIKAQKASPTMQDARQQGVGQDGQGKMFPPLAVQPHPPLMKGQAGHPNRLLSKKLRKLSPRETARHQAERSQPTPDSSAALITELMRVVATELSLFPSPQQMGDIDDPINVASSLPVCEQRISLLNRCFERIVTEASPLYPFLLLWMREYQGQCSLLRCTVERITQRVWKLEEDNSVLKDQTLFPPGKPQEAVEAEPARQPGAAVEEGLQDVAVGDQLGLSMRQSVSLEANPLGLPKYSFEESEPNTPSDKALEEVGVVSAMRGMNERRFTSSGGDDGQALAAATEEIRRLKETTVPKKQLLHVQKVAEKMSRKLQSSAEEYQRKARAMQQEIESLTSKLHETQDKMLHIVTDTEDQKRHQVAAVKMIMTTKLATKRTKLADAAVQAMVETREHSTMTEGLEEREDAPLMGRRGSVLPGKARRGSVQAQMHGRRSSAVAIDVDLFGGRRPSRVGKEDLRRIASREQLRETRDQAVQVECRPDSPTGRRRSSRHSLTLFPERQEETRIAAYDDGLLDIHPAADYRLIQLQQDAVSTPALLAMLEGLKGFYGRLYDKRDLAVIENDGRLLSLRGALNGLPKDLGFVSYLMTATLHKGATWLVSVSKGPWRAVVHDELEQVRRSAADDALQLSDNLNTVLGSDWGTVYHLADTTPWGLEHYTFEEVDLVRYANPMTGTLYHDSVVWAVSDMEPTSWIPSDVLEYIHSVPYTEMLKRDKWEVHPLSDPELRSVQLRCGNWQGTDVERRELHRLAAKVLQQEADVAFGGIFVTRRHILELVERATRNCFCTPMLLSRVLQLQALVYKKSVYVLLLTTQGDEGAYLLDVTAQTVHDLYRSGTQHHHQPTAVMNSALDSGATPFIEISHPQHGGRYVCSNLEATELFGLAFKRNDLRARWTGMAFAISRDGEELGTVDPENVTADLGAWVLPRVLPLVSAAHQLCSKLAPDTASPPAVCRKLRDEDTPRINPFREGTAIRWHGFSFATSPSALDPTRHDGALLTITAASAASLAPCHRYSRLSTYLLPPVPLLVKDITTRPQLGVVLHELTEKEACSTALHGLMGSSDITAPDAVIELWQKSANPSEALWHLANMPQEPYTVPLAQQLIRAGACRDVLRDHALGNLESETQVRLMLQCGCRATETDPATKKTLFQLACERGYTETAGVLLAAGALPDGTADRADALFAVLSSIGEAGMPIVRSLCSADVLVSRSSAGLTPLHAAVQSASLPLVKLLIGVGSDYHVHDSDGRTPLDLAFELSDLPIVMHLEQASGMSLKMEDFPDLPFHRAAEKNRPDSVAGLLHYGFDPNTVDDTGRTPLDVALHLSHSAVAKVLRAVTVGVSVPYQT